MPGFRHGLAWRLGRLNHRCGPGDDAPTDRFEGDVGLANERCARTTWSGDGWVAVVAHHHPDLPLDSDAPAEGATGSAVLLVAAGGAAGAAARWALEQHWPASADGVPWATLAINVSGTFLLGLLMAVVVEARRGPGWLRPALGVGVLGGYTTFSTFALELRDLLAAGHGGSAAAYAVASVFGGLLAAWLGIVVGEKATGG